MATARLDRFDRLKGTGFACVLTLALLMSAWLMSLALRSPDGLWLAWFTLIPLFFAIRILSPVRSMLAGVFWAACFFGISAGAADTPFSATYGTLLRLVAAIGGYAWVGSHLTRRIGFSPLLLGLGWIGVEFVLQPLGLRNGLLAGTQAHGLVVQTAGYMAGYVVVAFVVAYANAALLSILSDVAVVVVSSSKRLMAGSTADNRLRPLTDKALSLCLISPSQPRAPPMS